MYSNDFQAFGPQSSPQGMPTKLPKFVEGTVYQLARALYAVHAENETQPANAIQVAIRIFVNDQDRNKILQAAKGTAEAITRKRAIQLKTTRSQQSMTISEQAEQLKIQLIARLKINRDAAWEASQNSEGTTLEETSKSEETYYSQGKFERGSPDGYLFRRRDRRSFSKTTKKKTHRQRR
jgi:hypothetical protein